MNLEEDEQFTEFLRGKAREGKTAVGYPATLFHQILNADGGFATVKRLLAASKVSDGYTELVVRGRPDLTVEALVAETRWRKYFDPQLVEIAETRLRRTGYAVRISPDNVGAGYDILSTWPGNERYIEVKTTVAAAPEFFLTENERRTLAVLGEQAWIFRVELGASTPMVTEYQNPVAKFDGRMSPSAWRVKLR